MRFDFYNHFCIDALGYIAFSNHKLEVYNYAYNSLQPFYIPTRTPETDFDTNQLRIAYNTARTLCSYHLDRKELYFDIVASLLSHLNFVTKNSNHYLQIYESRYKRLRDFSKTTRIGELAQGINSLFVQERLNYPFVIDFHYFHEKVYGTPYGTGSTPDFIILSSDFSRVGLFESKGEGAINSKITGKDGKLSDALAQLDIITRPCAEELIPICSRFENNSDDAKNSSIHYSIITRTCVEPSAPLRVLRMHYASWFYLIGDFERATQLLEEKGFDDLEGDDRYTLGTDNQENKIYWVQRFILPNLEDETMQTTFGLSINHIYSDNQFRIGLYESVIKILLTENLGEPISIEINLEDEEYQRFTDGTIIKLGREKKKTTSKI